MDFTLQSLCQVLDCKGGKGSNVAAAGAAAEAIGLHALRETGTINLRQSGGSAAREKGGARERAAYSTLARTIRNHYTTFLQP